MNADARKAEWILSRRKAWNGFTSLTNRMIDSEAFQALTSVHSVKALIWFWSMASYAKEKRRPGQESPIGNLKKITNRTDLSFEYRVAGYRGMRPDQFVRALRELHRYGFIDILHHGRGIQGDWTRYAYSDRWKTFNTPQWKELPFPVSDRVGWRATKKNYYAKAELSTTRKRSCRAKKTPNDYGIAELKTPISTDSPTTHSSSPSRSTRQCPALAVEGSDLKGGKNGSKGLKVNSGQSRRVNIKPVGGWIEEYEGMVPGFDYGTEGTVH